MVISSQNLAFKELLAFILELSNPIPIAFRRLLNIWWLLYPIRWFFSSINIGLALSRLSSYSHFEAYTRTWPILNFTKFLKSLIDNYFFNLVTLDYVWVFSHFSLPFINLLLSARKHGLFVYFGNEFLVCVNDTRNRLGTSALRWINQCAFEFKETTRGIRGEEGIQLKSCCVVVVLSWLWQTSVKNMHVI
jgi:hypothetical protein